MIVEDAAKTCQNTPKYKMKSAVIAYLKIVVQFLLFRPFGRIIILSLSRVFLRLSVKKENNSGSKFSQERPLEIHASASGVALNCLNWPLVHYR